MANYGMNRDYNTNTTSITNTGWQEADYIVAPDSWKPNTTTITTLPDVVRDKKGKNTLTRDQRVKNKMKLIEALGDEVAKLKARPDEPDYGSVVRFNKQFTTDGKIYDYAAICAGDGLWYITGGTSPQGLSWDQLLDFVEQDAVDELTIEKVDKWKVMK